MLMAAARLDLASVFLYAGSIMPGQVDGTTSRSSTPSRRSALPGRQDRREEVDRIERAICPGEGACGGMYTANTFRGGRGDRHEPARLGRAARGRPAPRRLRAPPGEAVVGLLRQGITARQIMTLEASRTRSPW
jgi:dihydroxy-acid dehydratase